MLYRNLPLKLAAIGLAIFLRFWVTVTGEGIGQSGDLRIRTTGVSSISARLVPVILETKGVLPANLVVESAQLDPPMVTVVGSPLRLGDMTCIRTEQLDLSRVSSSLDTELRLVVPQGFQVPNTETVKLTLAVSSGSGSQQSGSPTG